METKFKAGALLYDVLDGLRYEPGFVVRPILLLEYHAGVDGSAYDVPWWRVLYEGSILDWNADYVDRRCERLYEERN